MAEMTVELLSKQTEYKEIIDHFKRWNKWQQHYFLCQYTLSFDTHILEILLTDFEPLYHSGYKSLTEENAKEALAQSSSSFSATGINSSKRKSARRKMRDKQRGAKRGRFPPERLLHEHACETIFDSKTIADYIPRPNPINMVVYNKSMDTTSMKEIFLEEIKLLQQIYKNWESYEYIHSIHLLFPHCGKATLLYLSFCINKRVHTNDMVLKLPDLAVQKILSHLSPKDLCNSALVCRNWKKFAYKSVAWKRHAMDLNYGAMNLNFSGISPNDIIWRRIYLELFELAKMKTVQPRLRYGSIIQTFQTQKNPQLNGPRRTTVRRKSLVPDMLKFQLKKPTVNLAIIAEDVIKSRTPSPTKITPRKAKIVNRIESSKSNILEETSALSPVPPMIVPAPIEEVTLYDLVPPQDPDDLGVIRVASVHGSCCQDDELAYEETFPSPKRHSQRHVAFVKDLTGYSNWMSALAMTYPLREVTELVGHKQPVFCFQADALRIISGCNNGVIRIWDAKTGRPLKKAVAHKGAVNSLQFDGHKVVTGGWDTMVKIFSVSTLRCLAVLPGHTDSVTRVIFDKRHLLSFSLDRTVRVHLPQGGLSSYACEHVIFGHEAGITHGDMDGEHILTGSLDHTIRVWCARFYNPIRVVHCGAPIVHFTFEQGLILASTTDARLLFVDRRREVPSHSISAGEYTVNFTWIYGSRFITGDTAGLVKEWDLPSGALLRVLHGHYGQVMCLQANKNQIISSSLDHTIKIWHLAQLKSTDNTLE